MGTSFYAQPLFIKQSGRLIQVKPQDIVCVEADRAYSNIYVNGMNKSLRMTCPLSQVLKTLPKDLLVRVGRSYAVSIHHIKEIGESTFTMDNGLIFSTNEDACKHLQEGLLIVG